MSQTETELLEGYLNRVRPIYHQLFNLAHALTGSVDAAEYCLQCTLLQGWTAGEEAGSRHGFRESMRRELIYAGLKNLSAEPDWDGLNAPAEDDAMQQAVAQEGTDMRRVLALHCGCRLSVRQIARACGMEPRRVKAMLRRFEARVRRRLGSAGKPMDAQIARAVRSMLAQPGSLAPDMLSMFRSFQSDAGAAQRPSRLPGRIFRAALAVMLALLCAAAFWFAAVLLQPPVLEDAASQGTIQTNALQGENHK